MSAIGRNGNAADVRRSNRMRGSESQCAGILLARTERIGTVGDCYVLRRRKGDRNK